MSLHDTKNIANGPKITIPICEISTILSLVINYCIIIQLTVVKLTTVNYVITTLLMWGTYQALSLSTISNASNHAVPSLFSDDLLTAT